MTLLHAPIAITGIGCRLPGNISSPSELWQFLADGRSAQGDMPKSRFNMDSYRGQPGQPATTRAAGGYFLSEDIRNFDNSFFGINNREASGMDPQQRKLLEVVFECLESAGTTLDEVSGANIGCYVASFVPDFIANQAKDIESLTRYTQTGLGTTLLANRISHIFNLKGPSSVIDTACSSSLYALHAASSALLAGEIDGAVVAGVNIIQSPEMHVCISQAGVLSPTSTCHTFDASADGYGRADGVNAIFIKRLDDAVRDGDPIQSVIRSVAINSNGRTPGITQPSIDGQEAVINKSYSRAGLSPSDTYYVEAHGTGTSIGDPMEVEAISRVFQKDDGRSHPIRVGSVKTNLGHSEAASGLTSIIKATLALQKGEVPPTVGIKKLNPKLNCDKLGVEVVTSKIPFPGSTNGASRISVNSFGYGGANAHCIIEAVGGSKPTNGLLTNGKLTNGQLANGSLTNGHGDNSTESFFLLPISANNSSSLNKRVEALSKFGLSSVSIEDLAYTLGERRSHLAHRGYIVAKQSSITDDVTIDNLQTSALGQDIEPNAKFGFVFTGQGAQWKGMAHSLLQFPIFANTIRQLDDYLSSTAHPPEWSLYDILTNQSDVSRAELAQPITTAVQIGIVDLLREWEIFPEAAIGHSSGEIGAAYASGSISAREAILIAYYRGFSVTKLTTVGAMAAAGLGPAQANERLEKLHVSNTVRVACINSPESVTLSGDVSGIDSITEELNKEGIFIRKLKTDGRAYHSHHMEEISNIYETLLTQEVFSKNLVNGEVESEKRAVKMVSTVTCEEVIGDTLRSVSYWTKNLTSPVRFSDGLEKLNHLTRDLKFVEVGPHAALKSPVLQTLGKTTIYFSAQVRGTDSAVTLLSLVGNLYIRGFQANLSKVRESSTLAHKRHITPRVILNLPTYPWHYEDEPLWAESRLSHEARFRKVQRHELLGSLVPGGNGSTKAWRNVFRLEDVPWVRDHKLDEKVVFPGAGYLAMAMEALSQTLPPGSSLDEKSILFHHVDIIRALPLEEGESTELHTELSPISLSNTANYKDWWTFQICSVSSDTVSLHCKGSLRFEPSESASQLELPAKTCRVAPQSRRLWYEALEKGGIGFGPDFQQLDEVYTSDPKGEFYAEATTKSMIPLANEGKTYQSDCYVVHPTIIDAALQVCLISSTGGLINEVKARVPVRISKARFALPKDTASPGILRSSSKAIGVSAHRATTVLLDSEGRTVVHIQDIDTTEFFGTIESEDRHPIYRVLWRPDFGAIRTNDDLTHALQYTLSCTKSHNSTSPEGDMLTAISLAAHKNPESRVLFITQDETLLSRVLANILDATSYFRRFQSISVGRQNSDSRELEIASLTQFASPIDLGAFTYRKPATGDKFEIVILGEDLGTLGSLRQNTTPESIILRTVGEGEVESLLPEGFTALRSTGAQSGSVQLLRQVPGEVRKFPHYAKVICVRDSSLNNPDSHLEQSLARMLNAPVHKMTLEEMAEAQIPQDTLIISTAELGREVLVDPTQEEFNAINKMMDHAKHLVWVTRGKQSGTYNPTHSLFAGLARAVMVEQPLARIFTLEMHPHADLADLAGDIKVILEQSQNSSLDYEYMKNEKGGLMVSRTVPDELMNQAFRERQNRLAQSIPLKNAGNATLSLEKAGQLSTAQFVKTPLSQLNDNDVVIRVLCLGLNAKNVYALAGRLNVPPKGFSLEYTGEIVAVGSAVSSLAVGDQVTAFYPNYFGTYLIAPSWSCIKLKNGEDLREMATVLVVVVTAIYALQHRAHFQPGESILVHSAAGAAGIAAIQVAKLMGAGEIFATVGTEDKKQYLVESFGLRAENIFNSREAGFAAGIKQATNGRGVDVIINSLVGELLHEGWECLADFGRFVEIGKKDILDAGRLNMEGFARGTTFTAFDLQNLIESSLPAHRRLFRSMLEQAVELVRGGQVQTIKPLSVFNVSDVASAFHHFNSAKRMGKIVISFEDENQIVPVVPEKFSTLLDPNKAYLLIGCLGGLGRSLSKWMLSRGARQFIFVGRTGTQKQAAKQLIEDLKAAGAICTVITGDVTNYDDVVRALKSTETPLGGVVQAAMGLSVSFFNTMSKESWISGIEAKVQGTWNLHNALASLDKEKDLDFFIMTSSVSGKVGTATESNYCAANNFLDIFASYRRSLGLKGIALGLGMISEVGYLHENPHIEELLLRKGIRPINEDEVLQIFDFGMSSPPTSAQPTDLLSYSHILTGLEVTGLQRKHKRGYNGYWEFLAGSRFSLLTSSLKRSSGDEATQGPSSQSSTIADAIASKDDATLMDAICKVITKKLSFLILLPVEKLDIKTALSDFGMDSMLAAELRQYIFGATNVDISFLELMDKKTSVTSLAKSVMAKLQES
ncbi:unnamed protein product [Clonostachys byssicola]|uniref:Polyketide synthase n=1 Tax=Clonostachys byssicola TaxID=160290 RepID=A0A9N9UJ06_9HYPO|nr:unnamed protein product [Clonostachys byssicola]